MNGILLPLCILICILSSCGNYAYISNFEKSTNTHKNYDTAALSILPRISEGETLVFDIVNKSKEPFQILWNESTVTINGRLVHLQQTVPIQTTTLNYNTSNLRQSNPLVPVSNVLQSQGSIGVGSLTTFIPPQTQYAFTTVPLKINIWKAQLETIGKDTILKNKEIGRVKLKTFETKDSFAQNFRAYITLVNANDPKQKIVFDETYTQKDIIRASADKIQYLHPRFENMNTTSYEPKEGTKLVYAMVGVGLLALVAIGSVAETNASQ